MKTTSFLVSMLFGSFAVAAPMNRRALQTYTSTVIQTEIVYTTVYDGEVPEATATSAAEVIESTSAVEVPASTSSAAAFFEESTNSPVVAPTSAPAPIPTTIKTSAVAVPTTTSSVVEPSSEVPSSSAAPTTTAPTTTQAPATTAAPTTTAAPVEPSTTSVVAEVASTTSAAAAAATTASSSSGSGGDVHTGGSMTLNYFNDALGSCGKPIADTDMTVALASDLYGASTYDVATGNPTNPWCGKTVAITYNGKTHNAKIMDKCAGCTNGGFDMTPSLWEAVTGTSVGDRITGMTWTTV